MRVSRKAAVLAAVCLGALACAVQPAFGQTDPVVRDALAQVQAGHAADAYKVLSPLTAKRAGDKDFDYALGVAAVDSGHVLEGILALQRVLARDPANGPARAELARAYALAGDLNTAKREFDTVVDDPTLPDPVRQRLAGVVNQLSRAQAGGGVDVGGFVELSSGYDGNINTATSQSQLLIPLFSSLGPAQLSPGAMQMHDGFVQGNAGVSAVWGLSRQARLFVSGLATVRDNFDSNTFDQIAITGTAGSAFTLANRDVISASAQYQPFWIDGERYRDTLGLIGQYTKPLEGGAALAFAVQAFKLDYNTDPLRDAKRYGASVTYTGRTYVASAQGGVEKTDSAAADAQSYRYGGLSLAAEYPLGPKMSVSASAGAEARRYDAPDVLFLTTRHDNQYDVGVGLKYLLAKDLILRPQVTYTRNQSNIALYDYDRVTASLTVRKEF